MRRAVRYGYTFLNLKTPFIYKLVNKLSDQLANAFDISELIENIIKEEEASFLRTLEKGILKLNEMLFRMQILA